MKAFLMYKNRDFDLEGNLPLNKEMLIQDLELNTLLDAMALGNTFLFEVAKKAVLSSLNNLDAILYRQHILKDCLKNPSIVRNIYDIAVESTDKKKRGYFGIFPRSPGGVLYGSVEMIQFFMSLLKRLKGIADEHADKFESEGFRAFFAMLDQELGDEFFAGVENHLRELKFRDGVLISAQLGKDNKGTNYILRKPQEKAKGWMKRMFAKKAPAYTFCIHDRDESGARALSELNDRGINLVANAVAQSADHILSFFNMLRNELAFYVGCLNLYDQLTQKGEPICFPSPIPPDERSHSFRGLYDVCLALSVERKVVGNDLNADNKHLVVITGANQGGKSTFLRSIGSAQFMMQCGLFVPAESFYSNVCDGIFTHYKREEDATMNSGKLDEELSRMSDIADVITSNSIVLFNESFAATNEREGSEIARQIVSALSEKHIKVFFVTHLYDFAHSCYSNNIEDTIFLRAVRETDGSRTFKIIEAEPLETSFGEDLYNEIFGVDN